VMTGLRHRLHVMMERRFPEKRLFLRSDDQTRFIRLRPATQLMAWSGSAVLIGWTIVATAILIMDSIGAGNFRAQALRDQMTYEERLNVLSSERDQRAAEAIAAQQRFNSALEQISLMQSELLRSEERRRELETGIEVIQATLRRTMAERADAQERVDLLQAALDGNGDVLPGTGGSADAAGTVDLLAAALAETAEERDQIASDAEFALEHAAEMELELRLLQEKNDAIFSQLEEAFTVSVEPLDNMFRCRRHGPRPGAKHRAQRLFRHRRPVDAAAILDPRWPQRPRRRARQFHPAPDGPAEHVSHRRRTHPLRHAGKGRVPLHQRLRHALGPDAQRHRLRGPGRHPDIRPG